jgi:chromosome segregation ATPase
MSQIRRIALLTSCLFVISCGEDPELVRKHGEQEAEMAKLKGEITLLEERLKYLPPDQSSDLATAERESLKLEAEHKQLEAEVEKLKAEQDELKKQYEDYKRKYAVR